MAPVAIRLSGRVRWPRSLMMVITCLCLLGPARRARGQCLADQLSKLTASDGAPYDSFGNSVSISGDTTLVGAPFEEGIWDSTGSAYVFRRAGNAWHQEAKLTASDAGVHDQFGWAVSIRGDTAVVGAAMDDDAGIDDGSAYVFRFDGTGWIEEAKLTASDAESFDKFGWAVAAGGDVVVVGAAGNDDAGSKSGSAYVFRFDGTGWAEEAKLTAADAAAYDYFGWAVGADGARTVIGAWGDDDAAGAAYIFHDDGDTWHEEAKLVAADASSEDLFGWAVSIRANLVIAGAYGDDHAGGESGSAYAFRRDGLTWSQDGKLTASDAAPGDRFGGSVAGAGNVALIGAFLDDNVSQDAGAAYVYHRLDGSGWTEGAKLLASDAAASDAFGVSVALDGDLGVVGANWDDDHGDGSGSAYVFGGLGDCNENGMLDACDIADGSSEDENSNGVPDECEMPGDLNCDRVVDTLDIDPFVLALVDPAAYTAEYPDCDINHADTNGDGIINGGDVHAFVALLIS